MLGRTALGPRDACSLIKHWNIVLFVFCFSGYCGLCSPSHLFMALMQKFVMAVIASSLLIACSPGLQTKELKPLPRSETVSSQWARRRRELLMHLLQEHLDVK